MDVAKSLFLSSFCLLLAVAPAFAVGQAGLDFDVLSVGVGARPLGMGGAFTAVADNADAPYWNPAGLGYLKNNEITTMQTRLSTDADHYYVSYIQPLWKGTLGISWIQISAGSLSNTSATVDAYNEVNTISIFSYFSNAYLLSYGLKITERISAGLTAKYLSSDMSKISGGQGYGYSIAPGVMLKPNDIFTIGLRIDELFNKVVWGTGSAEKAPPKLHLGIAARPVLPKISGLFSLDFSQTMKEGYIGSFALGYEWERQGLSLRCGYADSSFSAGAGFESGVARIDYAYVQSNELTRSNCHRISLSGKW
ncbi:hypothetical protein A2276_04875 [candidate division WOR-1 bacterium RIFOXYA12_FULL_43_27]|uniref:PorV/PorQ family protein n=1 Tax=candidate division WOR-1 bacterium RIFOXYC2_FULL_46_14 TaxID=1802587 RepID=A0A1F4U8G2_UNCSA|nr:MAG: hypothetical protein A2276_04875 [candidate division WOR-1 bacterium RIFOXYA12_FULL_43_27]OGC20000.1 MAG: hypothetical protein A2292_02880 [candidate division WOR-1 bacterium RIFOXYB2_FULL_46_45]OGC32263.1 MAG: hypothetical protein A2232_08565 [candidate division WOR-1 bacterium RIFOXYA2_FULL_46_56]OGC41167.1 MAG: hypothetical protein A2438_07505 [candidate division WOR-1 bacterium RIFOXYC2_FULL_46_14]